MKVKEILGNYSKWIPSQDYESTKPEVSVLLPTFRRAKSGLFEAAVQSVLNQDFKNLELIIIDDASTDGTADLITHFMKNDSRVSCIRHERNVGLPAISEYEGYMKARGEYIAFIFDDNEWERDYISRTINFMVRNKAKAAYGIVRSYYGDGTQYIELGVSNKEIGLHTLCATNYIANGGVILKREVIEDVGLYDPHVSLTRLCDWDLWKRIIRNYEFFETGILAGKEMGIMLSDSLGNSYKMNTWTVAEREGKIRNNLLLPNCYHEIDIDAISSQDTQSYIDSVYNLYCKFKSKKWYNGTIKIEQFNKEKKKILIISSSYDATTELTFNRLVGYSSSIVFKFVRPDVPIYEIIQSDAVILVRNLVTLNHFKFICNKLSIPCYYYVDDNFDILYKENPSNMEIKNLVSYWSFSNLEGFTGIFTSTNLLKNYFIENKLHSRVIVQPPVIKEEILSFKNINKNEVVFSYMGNSFRDREFVNIVIPALNRLAQNRKIKVLFPDRIKLASVYQKNSNLELTKIPVSLSLELALKRYGAHNPSFLLHCGANIENNKYKTENALINAVSLGTVLITSKTKQFESIEKLGYCVCAENTIESWYEVLDSLLQNEQSCNEMYSCAVHYCKQQYSIEKTLLCLKNEIDKIQTCNYYEFIERYNEILFDILYNNSMIMTQGMRPTDAIEGETLELNSNRSLTESPLVFSGGIEHSREYRFVCDKETFSRFGICFASLGVPSGKVKIQIRTIQQMLREQIIDLYDFVRDNWTYIEFDPIEHAKNVEFIVRLEFEYDQGSDLVGVFEDGNKRSLLYRIAKKLGHPLPVKNLLYVDCQA